MYFCGPPVAQQTISVTRYLKPGGGNAMMGLVYHWICIQAGIDHDPVDEVIHHAGDAVHAAEPVVEAGRILGDHRCILLLPPVGSVSTGMLEGSPPREIASVLSANISNASRKR